MTNPLILAIEKSLDEALNEYSSAILVGFKPLIKDTFFSNLKMEMKILKIKDHETTEKKEINNT